MKDEVCDALHAHILGGQYKVTKNTDSSVALESYEKPVERWKITIEKEV